MQVGLIPKVADEWVGLLPVDLRNVPIVWLGEKPKKPWIPPESILKIDTDLLDSEHLHKLNLHDVSWWAYQGTIPPVAIAQLKERQQS